MTRDNLFSLLEKEFDINHCMEVLTAIWENDRWIDFKAFEKTADYCENIMKESGLSEVERLSLSADGTTLYGDWPMPQAWDAYSAALTIADTGEKLADYMDTPTSLAMYSAPTQKGGISAQVVDADILGDLNEAELSDYKGKIFLTSKKANEVAALAIKAGAAGIVTDFVPLYPGVRDNPMDLKGHSRWESDFCFPKNDTGLFAFSLSPENGLLLRDRMKEGAVVLSAEVNTAFRDGEAYVVSGAIPGETMEEVLAYGHLYEPGALDNASGCALILELARCLKRCIDKGVLPKPKRTLRFVVGWECVGSTAWIVAHPKRQQNTFSGIVADMVGSEAIDNTYLRIWHNPLSNYGFADALISELLTEQRRFLNLEYPAEQRPFSLGSDNILGDPSWDIPTVALITEPALSYHSSMDRPERIDPSILARCAILTGSYMWECSEMSQEECQRLNDKAKKTLEETEKGCKLLQELAEQKLAEKESAPKESPIPKRLVQGCLTLQNNAKINNAPWKPAWNSELNMPLFLMDGRRSVEQVIRLSAIEAGEADLDEYREKMTAYFQFLAEHGYLES